MASNTDTICFQDVWKNIYCRKNRDGVRSDDGVIEELFFDLANVRQVSYRLPRPPQHEGQHKKNIDDKRRNVVITIQQDIEGAANKHTGGIVWETCYLLLNYLLMIDNMGQLQQRQHAVVNTGQGSAKTQQRLRSTTLLEVGAGCGMLGMVLRTATEMDLALRLFNDDDSNNDVVNGKDQETREISTKLGKVILTETSEVLPNLHENVRRNTLDGDSRCDLQVHALDWTTFEIDCRTAGIEQSSVDWIVGTDVLFSPTLVVPLLQTLAYLSHSNTVIYLCLQERCAKSYQLLFEKGQSGDFYTSDDSTEEKHRRSFKIEDISNRVYSQFSQSCGWGARMECKLLRLKVKEQNTDEKKKRKRRRSDGSS